MTTRQIRLHASRRGITSVVVLICLVVVTLMSGVLVKIGVAHRDQVRAQERQLQAEWLAQAGLDRARLPPDRQHGYTGETWQIGPADLVPGTADSAGQEKGAVVRITVEPAGAGSSAKLIKVQADYPPDPRAGPAIPFRYRSSLVRSREEFRDDSYVRLHIV